MSHRRLALTETSEKRLRQTQLRRLSAAPKVPNISIAYTFYVCFAHTPVE